MSTLPKDDIVWLWNTTKLSAGQIANKYKTTKGTVLGIIHRDPRSKPRKPPSRLQQAKRRIAALEKEVKRLQELEASLARNPARMEWKAAA